MNFDIRTLEKKDFYQLKKLYDLLCNDNISSIEIMQQIYEKMLADRNYHVLVAVLNEHVIGSVVGITCQEMTRTGAPFMIIEDMIVAVDFRKKGVGQALIEEMEKLAITDGCFSIILLSSESHDSHGFYDRCGYNQRVGFRKDFN